MRKAHGMARRGSVRFQISNRYDLDNQAAYLAPLFRWHAFINSTWCESSMTDDIARGKAKQVEGKARQKAGDLTDNHSEEVKGVAKQVEGKIQEGIGKIKKKIDD